jgi:hypothetical protein
VYDDGDYEKNVPSELVRLHDQKGFQIDEVVEAMYRKNNEWYPGYVSDAHQDGSYDIVYDDGDYEKNVPHELVRKSNLNIAFHVGDDVEVLNTENSQLYISKVTDSKEDITSM